MSVVVGRKKGKKQVVVYLSPELHDDLRLQSARTRRTMSDLVERALRTHLTRERRRTPLSQHPDVDSSEVVDALASYGAPLWSSGRASALSLEQAIARGLALARQHPAVLRVLPVVLYKNRSRLSWPGLRGAVGDQLLAALGMLLELTAEITDAQIFRDWAAELEHAAVKQQPPVAFFVGRPPSERREELAELRTPAVVRKWGFTMATPLQDFQEAVTRFCQRQPSSTAPT